VLYSENFRIHHAKSHIIIQDSPYQPLETFPEHMRKNTNHLGYRGRLYPSSLNITPHFEEVNNGLGLIPLCVLLISIIVEGSRRA
jgi:hypothetical protein